MKEGCTKKGCKLGEKLKVVLAWARLRAGRPLDGGSARLSMEGTYNKEIQNLYHASNKVILCKTKFCSGLLDFSPWIAWMTPWLSDLIRK